MRQQQNLLCFPSCTVRKKQRFPPNPPPRTLLQVKERTNTEPKWEGAGETPGPCLGSISPSTARGAQRTLVQGQGWLQPQGVCAHSVCVSSSTCSPQNHCRFQDLGHSGCCRPGSGLSITPRIQAAGMSLQSGAFCLGYRVCWSSGQDLPLLLRGMSCSHVAFLPIISQAPYCRTQQDYGGQVRVCGIPQGPWRLEVEAVPRHAAPLPGPVRHIRPALQTHTDAEAGPCSSGRLHTHNQQKLCRPRHF